MAGHVRSPVRAALSRLPGWVPALGVVLVLGELACGTVLLAARPHGGTARPHGGTGRSAAMRTAVLRVDGGHAVCNPADSCGPRVAYNTPTAQMAMSSVVMPFVKTVRVRAPGWVSLTANSGTQDWATCSITVNGTVVSQVKSSGFSPCWASIP